MGRRIILIRGIGEIGSAVAWTLRQAGFDAVLQQEGLPTTIRRPMAFSDAVFDGRAALEGVTALRIEDAAGMAAALAAGAVPVFAGPLDRALGLAAFDGLVDARMHKRSGPEPQIGLAPLVIGLGPNCVAGSNVDLGIETSWDDLGRVVRNGATLPLRGDPRAVNGYARERFSYAPAAGVMRTGRAIGENVGAGEVLAWIGEHPIRAVFAGLVRGLTRDGVPVTAGTKVAEVDPRPNARLSGIEERPRRIAEAVVAVISAR